MKVDRELMKIMRYRPGIRIREQGEAGLIMAACVGLAICFLTIALAVR